MSKICKVHKSGDSLVVTIPSSIAEMSNIVNGTEMELTVFPGGLQFKIVK